MVLTVMIRAFGVGSLQMDQYIVLFHRTKNVWVHQALTMGLESTEVVPILEALLKPPKNHSTLIKVT